MSPSLRQFQNSRLGLCFLGIPKTQRKLRDPVQFHLNRSSVSETPPAACPWIPKVRKSGSIPEVGRGLRADGHSLVLLIVAIQNLFYL